MLTRRTFAALGCAAGLAACARSGAGAVTRAATSSAADFTPPLPEFYGAVLDEPYPVPAVPEGVLSPDLWRRDVPNRWPAHPRGTIIVDPDAAILHFVESSEQATRFGVSVGATGREWHGTARLQFSRKWPRWNVPDDMIARRPDLAPYSVAQGGMDPGPGNPMGARALYLFQNGVDTLYRVHGDASPRELGKAVSSGCIRMLNQDVIYLYARAVHGAEVIVLPSLKHKGPGALY